MSVVFSIAFIYLMSAFAEQISWLCIFVLQIALLGSTVTLYMFRQEKIQHHLEMLEQGLFEAESTSDKDLSAEERNLLILMIISGLMAFFFFCCVCCGFSSLKMAIDVIDASADFLAKTKRIIFVPCLFFILQLILILVWIGAIMCVVSMNEISADQYIPQGKNLKWRAETKWMFAYMVFGIIWICSWLDYCSTFIVMVSSATYYFNSSQKFEGSAEVSLGFTWAFLFHAGSIAIGSLVIAVVRFFRYCVVYFAQKVEKISGENRVAKAVVSCA
jgi:hypothetical protein